VKFQLSEIKNFFWPPDVSLRLRRAELTFWAFILALTYLPLPFGFLAWFALARPLAIITRLDNKAAFKAAYFYSFMSSLFQLYWVAVVTPPGMVAAVFLLSLYPAVILLVFKKIYDCRKMWGLVILPILWVGMEYFRSLSEFAFPWTDLSYSQGYYLTLIQIVSVIGCYGLSVILIALNILIWQTVSGADRVESRLKCGSIFVGILVALYAVGWALTPPVEIKGDMRVSLLQGNVDLSTKWKAETRDYNFVLYDSLASVAAGDSADLIIWPETAAPCYPRHEYHYGRLLGKTAVKSGAPNRRIRTSSRFYRGSLSRSMSGLSGPRMSSGGPIFIPAIRSSFSRPKKLIMPC